MLFVGEVGWRADPSPVTLHPEYETRKSVALNPKPCNLRPKPETLHPSPQTPNATRNATGVLGRGVGATVLFISLLLYYSRA